MFRSAGPGRVAQSASSACANWQSCYGVWGKLRQLDEKRASRLLALPTARKPSGRMG